ncbi:ribosomal protein S8 [Gonapodya prolifera JEL478]|uniref:Ribosomal protein S8 n=1 Tax=Gonapodya prolifera (strain JEL478) TaxID=1344416 RepID=A0A139APB7_GONPJ|nr:ribosomal protein S8 [Gonapodya prolifera JEL478]|eukprot:KXS18335.1 ribosomal protein S8 [Gonapodya prolifera JEL478]
MPPIHDLASHITNSFRAGLRRTAVRSNKRNLAVCEILYKEGFLSAIYKGDVNGPDNVGHPVPVTPYNVAQRRIWLDLKYRDNLPVLREMKPVSKSSRRVYATVDELKAVAAGKRAHSLVKPQVLGQVTILETEYGVMELTEALKLDIGGEVLAIVV